MRKNTRTATILGTVLFFAGLAVLVIVAMTILVPPSIPDGFASDMAETTDLPSVVGSWVEVRAPADDDEPINPETAAKSVEGDLNNSRVDSHNELPVPNQIQPGSVFQASPAQQQDEQFFDAIGRPISDHEMLGYTQPVRISIPAIGVGTTVGAVGVRSQAHEDEEQILQWAVPDGYAVGWHHTSAPLHAPGNTVLNGHNNMHGAVFRNLVDLELGERLILYDDDGSYEYEVTQRVLFEEDEQSMKERNWNARWMLPTSDERLTIISCWPFSTNTHRVVIVAHPADTVGT